MNPSVLLATVKAGNVDGVKAILPNSLDNKTEAFHEAVRLGNAEIVSALLPFVRPARKDSLALREAASFGYLEVVRLLMPLSNIKVNGSSPLAQAARHGHLSVVELLLPHSAPRANRSSALRVAAENGHKEIVRLLIPVSDSKAENSQALRWVLQKSSYDPDLAQVLAPVSDLAVVAELFIENFDWQALDRLAPFVSSGHERWLDQAPKGFLPQAEAVFRSQDRANSLAIIAPTGPAARRVRPRG